MSRTRPIQSDHGSARAAFADAMSRRFSQLTSWVREELHLAYEPAARVALEATRVNPSIIIGDECPPHFNATIRAAAGNLAARDAVAADVEAMVG